MLTPNFFPHSDFPRGIPSQTHWKSSPALTQISYFCQLGFTLSFPSSSSSSLHPIYSPLHPQQVFFLLSPLLILIYHFFLFFQLALSFTFLLILFKPLALNKNCLMLFSEMVLRPGLDWCENWATVYRMKGPGLQNVATAGENFPSDKSSSGGVQFKHSHGIFYSTSVLSRGITHDS